MSVGARQRSDGATASERPMMGRAWKVFWELERKTKVKKGFFVKTEYKNDFFRILAIYMLMKQCRFSMGFKVSKCIRFRIWGIASVLLLFSSCFPFIFILVLLNMIQTNTTEFSSLHM